MLWKIVGIAITCIISGLIVKQYKPEIAMLINICGGLIIFLLISNGVSDVLKEFINIDTDIEFNFVTPILKIVGVGYITEFTADLAEDSGNKMLANKVIFGGKIAICVLAMPILKKLTSAIFSLI